MKKVIVTGGAGFLGSHLCDFLIKRGESVVCIDNLSTGSKCNVSHLLESPSFKFIEHDITSPFYFNCDQIYNLACPASPVQYQLHPIETTRVSVLGSINSLDLAKKNNAKILQASTSEVYGNPEVSPQSEEYFGNVNPIGIRSCYDEGKRCAESLFYSYKIKHGVEIKIARIFNTYGPRMAVLDGRVVSNFIVQALQNEDITIYGDGSQTRSFCYVDNLIDGLVKLMESSDEFTGPVNLGNPNEHTIKELAEKVIELTQSSSNLAFKSLPENDPVRRQPDITLADKMLGWKPTVKLDEGLVHAINYFLQIVSSSDFDAKPKRTQKYIKRSMSEPI